LGGFFGSVSKNDCVLDVFFGTDYHSHLGTRRAGMALYDAEIGFQRAIHNIENSPFRTKFERDVEELHGTVGIGCISDSDAQPLLMRSKHGVYALTTIGIINNSAQLIEEFFAHGGSHFSAMTGGKVNSTELVAALLSQRDGLPEAIRYTQNKIQGSLSMLIMADDGIIAARDKFGRTPISVGHKEGAYCVSFETFAYQKLGYADYYELGPGEIVKISADGMKVLSPALDNMRICAFLWTYYGYPNSCYQGVNVEKMRNRNGRIMAQADMAEGNLGNIDYVAGVPDSGVPHAVGYSNASHIPFARPFIKYTPTWPRSFMPASQNVRDQVAKMKLIPVHDLIAGKKLLFVDDSIVRGTQIRGTVEFLYENGAEEVHVRSACPPIMFGCKYLNFSRSTSDMELIARRTIDEIEGPEGARHIPEYADEHTDRGKKMRCEICKKLHLTSLGYQSLDGLIKSIGIDPDKICTYCWTGKE